MNVKDYLLYILSFTAIASLFFWVLEKPHGYEAVIVGLLAYCSALNMRIVSIRRELIQLIRETQPGEVPENRSPRNLRM